MKTIDQRLRRDAIAIFRTGLSAVHAGNAVRRHLSLRSGVLKAGPHQLPLQQFDRIFLIGAGKAASAMSAAVADIIGERLTRGIVVTKHQHTGEGTRVLPHLEAGHPIPDEFGLAAAKQVTDLLRELNARDLLLVAVSGGASALLPAPAPPITLKAKQKTTGLLLRAGASIGEVNTVRKHLSRLKGGQLASLAYPATVVSLLLSDVIGDTLDVIGSGITAPDSTTFAEALDVLRRYSLEKRVPATVLHYLELGAEGVHPETPKPGNPVFQNVHNVVVGSNRLALEASAKEAKRLGYRPVILSSTIGGETREVAAVHAQILREVVASGHPTAPPACLLSGGETTVTIRGAGKGGRNQEFALAAAMELSGMPNVIALSAGTDGTDGPTDAAGAIANGSTIQRAMAEGISPTTHLTNNDSYPFFEALGDLIKTGPTDTNVMDLHVLLAGI